MPTIIAFHPSCYEVRFDVDLGNIAGMVHKLERRRYRSGRELSYTADGLPICPRHGMPMQKREKQGDRWFSHKITDPNSGKVSYCRGYASPSSPGFDILSEPIPAPPAVANLKKSADALSKETEQKGDGMQNGRSGNRSQQPLVDMNLEEFNQVFFG